MYCLLCQALQAALVQHAYCVSCITGGPRIARILRVRHYRRPSYSTHTACFACPTKFASDTIVWFYEKSAPLRGRTNYTLLLKFISDVYTLVSVYKIVSEAVFAELHQSIGCTIEGVKYCFMNTINAVVDTSVMVDVKFKWLNQNCKIVLFSELRTELQGLKFFLHISKLVTFNFILL